MSKSIMPIAIHLPQFHPIDENDRWWGKGFTEWVNVTKAAPKFPNHYQPHLPSDLGFYDLRLAETRTAQAELAKQFGIYGFCYYHYWFNGKRLLNRPLDEIIQSKSPQYPFMICWANENWTRRWDGADHEILIEQCYSESDDEAHINYLLNTVFIDDRYIKVNGKPFLLIYRPQLFPNIRRTLESWRSAARSFGFPDLHIGYMRAFALQDEPKDLGFDCAVEFHPDFYNLPNPIKPSLRELLSMKLGLKKSVHFTDKLYDYNEYVEKVISANIPRKPEIYKGLTPMWDNSARRKQGAHIFHNSKPEYYQRWLEFTIKQTIAAGGSEKFVFINAWNEWAEGNHLEPCQKWGRAYLEATLNALNKYA